MAETQSRILAVDDDPVSRQIIEAVLRKDGHSVTLCASAPEAIEALSFFDFDLVVTDIIMPGHDGFEVVQAIRHLRPGTRIIVLSAIDKRVPPQLSVKAFDQLGVNRVIRKPIDPAELASEVLAVLVAG